MPRGQEIFYRYIIKSTEKDVSEFEIQKLTAE